MGLEEEAPWNFGWGEEDEEEKMFEYLLSMGVIEEHGLDEDGEMTYTFNFEIMKELLPEMYEETMAGLNERLMGLYEEGLISIEYDEELKAHFSATEKGKKYFDEIGDLE